jgi:hypothetical protein
MMYAVHMEKQPDSYVREVPTVDVVNARKYAERYPMEIPRVSISPRHSMAEDIDG